MQPRAAAGTPGGDTQGLCPASTRARLGTITAGAGRARAVHNPGSALLHSSLRLLNMQRSQGTWMIQTDAASRNRPTADLSPVAVAGQSLSVSDSLRPRGLQPARPLRPWVLQARALERADIPSPGGLPHPGTEPESPALAYRLLTTEPPVKSMCLCCGLCAQPLSRV